MSAGWNDDVPSFRTSRGHIFAWLLVLGLLGGGGYAYYKLYRPLNAELAQARTDLTSAQTSTTGLKEELAVARTGLERLNDELRQAKDQLLKTAEEKAEHEKLMAKLKAELGGQGIEISGEGARIRLTMVDTILFKTGEAKLTDSGEKLLRDFAAALKDHKDKLIQVNGHTDNVPILTELKQIYPTNWELSAARAINVVKYLADRGIDPQRMTPAGLGQFRPVASNATAAGRQKNRRIEILLLPGRFEVVKGERPVAPEKPAAAEEPAPAKAAPAKEPAPTKAAPAKAAPAPTKAPPKKARKH